MSYDPQLIKTVAEWLQKSRYCAGRQIMRPVEGGKPIAEMLAKNLLAVIDANSTHDRMRQE